MWFDFIDFFLMGKTINLDHFQQKFPFTNFLILKINVYVGIIYFV